MSEQDSLSTFKFPNNSPFVKLSSDTSPHKLRILTTDPLVSMDKFGNTRFGFVVWDFNEEKAKILNATPGVAKEIQRLHQDEDLGANIRKIDVKVVTTGSGLETRHSLTPLTNAASLTNDQIRQCQEIKLEDKIENGQRMSFYDPGQALPSVDIDEDLQEESGYDKAKSKAEEIKKHKDAPNEIEQPDEEEIDLSEIPF